MEKIASQTKTFIEDFKKEINMDFDVKNLNDFEVFTIYNFLSAKKKCQGCQGISDCRQESRGYLPKLVNEGFYEIVSEPCKYGKASVENNRIGDFRQFFFFPEKLYKASLKEYRLDTEKRKILIKEAINFIKNISENKECRGFYIYGDFAKGKTYLCAAIANELAKYAIKSILVYFPDMVRNIKSSIENNTLEEKVNLFKEIPVLFLDDLGSENITPWIRDEILGPILQFRYLNQSPTFITSNFTQDRLCSHFADAGKENDNFKAMRLIVRIQELTKYFEI